MIRTNVCLRHTKEGDELKETDYDGCSIDISNDDYAGMIADFVTSNEITDEVAASAVELILDVARLDEPGERENIAQSIACSVVRQNFINNFGPEEMANGIITIMDETAFGAGVTVWVNQEGQEPRFYVTLGDEDVA
jgi:hypothetical protein